MTSEYNDIEKFEKNDTTKTREACVWKRWGKRKTTMERKTEEGQRQRLNRLATSKNTCMEVVMQWTIAKQKLLEEESQWMETEFREKERKREKVQI